MRQGSSPRSGAGLGSDPGSESGSSEGPDSKFAFSVQDVVFDSGFTSELGSEDERGRCYRRFQPSCQV